MNITTVKQGYKPDATDERDHIFGSGETPHPIILPSGNWNALFLPDEFQNRGFETYSCVTFSLLASCEKLAKLLFNETWDKSERFTYIASGTNPAEKGNSPRTVADSIRNKGTIDEKDLPFDSSITTIEQFDSPVPLTQDLLDKAASFLQDYEFRYDFLPTTKGEVTREMLRAALYRSPVCIAVYAWAEKDGTYHRLGDDIHFTLLTNVKDNNELEVFDSYAPSHKTLASDFAIYTAMRVYLRKKTEEEKQMEKKTNFIISVYRSFIKLLQDFILYRQQEAENVKISPTTLPNPENTQSPINTAKTPNSPSLPIEIMQEMAKRVCKEEKLTPIMTERLLKTIDCESGFKANVVNINKNGTKDCGLVQLNEKWYLTPNKMTCEDAIRLPERCVRIMAKAFKMGRARDWICYQKLFGTKKNE